MCFKIKILFIRSLKSESSYVVNMKILYSQESLAAQGKCDEF